ncbi:hypothetical protein GA0116948_10747 [Chitinophaga costaii]|uniref:Uncharacterized protein n=1 Tax=Chitinophaga costaii TaxID=1335309 RepID=A0A1C4E2I5_9BACT|nr:hypothetical protein GA0116948_10747 [Chitinophaga costaii]
MFPIMMMGVKINNLAQPFAVKKMGGFQSRFPVFAGYISEKYKHLPVMYQ